MEALKWGLYKVQEDLLTNIIEDLVACREQEKKELANSRRVGYETGIIRHDAKYDEIAYQISQLVKRRDDFRDLMKKLESA